MKTLTYRRMSDGKTIVSANHIGPDWYEIGDDKPKARKRLKAKLIARVSLFDDALNQLERDTEKEES